MHLGCRVCEQWAYRCKHMHLPGQGSIVPVTMINKHTANSIMLILTLLARTNSDATQARTHQLYCLDKATIAWCLESLPCSVLCVPACGTDHETIEPAQLDRALAAPAASCRSWERWARVQVQSPVWCCGWRGAAAAGPVRAGRCGAARAGASSSVHTSLVPATSVSTPLCTARPSAHLRHRDTIAHTAACVRVLPAAQPHCTN